VLSRPGMGWMQPSFDSRRTTNGFLDKIPDKKTDILVVPFL
jgi:hypothetical protein